MALNSIEQRIGNERTRHRSRKPARRHHAIRNLEQCESRALLATMYGLVNGSVLVKFPSVNPAVVYEMNPITNIREGETIRGLDFRPADGQLYALTTDTNHTGRLYTINTQSAVATLASTISLPVIGTSFGIDFNPSADRLRVVSDIDLNLRVDVTTGVATADGPLAYLAGDPSAGQDPRVVGSAYSNNYSGATATTLYQIDSDRDTLTIQNPPNSGTLTTVGALGVDASAVVGFDIQSGGISLHVGGGPGTPTPDRGYATLVVGGTTGLYQINLSTGAATLIGQVSAPVTALAIAPEGFTSKVEGSTVILNGSDSIDTLVIDQAGRLLRHNQFDFGVPGYASPFDFDSTTPGEQTVSSTDSAITVVINARGNYDEVTLGSRVEPFSTISATFKVNFRDGRSNRLTIEDSATQYEGTFTVLAHATSTGSGATIAGFVSPVIFDSTYNSEPEIFINTGKGDDTFNITENFGLSGFLTYLNGGGGSDTFNVDARGASVKSTTTDLRFLPYQTYISFVYYASIEQVNVVNVRDRPILVPPLTTAITIPAATAGTAFTDRLIARFEDYDLGTKAIDYHATIAWGDGTTSAGTVVQDPNNTSVYYIYGSHRYSAPGKFTVTSTILDTGGTSSITGTGYWAYPVWSDVLPLADGSFNLSVTNPLVITAGPTVTVTTTFLPEERPATISSQVLVNEAPITVEGRLDAASDTGLSNQDGITNDNTPTFTGTSAAGAVIQIFSSSDPATRRLLASAVADANGAWIATVLEPLADGVYSSLVVEATSATGAVHASGSLGSLTIDTVAPTVTGLDFRRLQGKVDVTFEDDRSGLNSTSLNNLANYEFSGVGPVGRPGRRFPITSITTTPLGTPARAQALNLLINQGRRLRAGRYSFTARSGGIEDLAGNALNGEFTGRFPSGNAQAGGHFVAGFRPFRKIVTASNPGATNAAARAAKNHGGNTHPAGPNQGARLANRLHAAALFQAQGRKLGR